MPRLLDAFCKQGGASTGYSQWFDDITGIDIERQPKYPYNFIHGDAIQYILDHGHEYDAIHASPPCQWYSVTWQLQMNDHDDLIPPTRNALQTAGKPYVIENVPPAPLRRDLTLCGCMFGIRTYRERVFETSGFHIPQPQHKEHTAKLAKMGRPPKDNEYLHIVGNFSNVNLGRTIMEMPHANRDGLREAIPASYSRYVGQYLSAQCR